MHWSYRSLVLSHRFLLWSLPLCMLLWYQSVSICSHLLTLSLLVKKLHIVIGMINSFFGHIFWRRALSICWIFNPFLFMSHIYFANSASLFFSIPRILLKCYLFQFVCHLPFQALSAGSAYLVCSEGGLSSWPCGWHVLEQCQSHGSNALLLSAHVTHTYLDASVNWVIRQ